MIKRFTKQLFSNELPKWFKYLNLSILLPILFWPLIFYTTIFFFDNPKNLGQTYLLFFVVNAYPIYLVIIAFFNSILFQRNKLIGYILPAVILLTLTYGIIYIFIDITKNISKSINRDNDRTKQGYIGVNDDYKIIKGKVYRYDTLIVGADEKSFEIMSWNWQRDKNHYYHFGKKVTYIDRQTFKDLGYHYGKDKINVYYDDKILVGADTKTFVQIEGTQDGKDKNNCYRWGKKVNCAELKTE